VFASVHIVVLSTNLIRLIARFLKEQVYNNIHYYKTSTFLMHVSRLRFHCLIMVHTEKKTVIVSYPHAMSKLAMFISC